MSQRQRIGLVVLPFIFREQEIIREDEPQETPLEEALEINTPSFNILGGMTNSGKTNLLLLLLEHNARKFNKIYILCPTAEMQEAYRKVVPPGYIISEPTIENVEKIMKEQKINKKRHAALVLDDAMSTMDLQFNKVLERLAASGRHFRITTFVLLQHLNRCSTVMKDNASTLFVTCLKQHSVKTAYDLQGEFDDYSAFKRFLHEYTKNFGVVKFALTADVRERIQFFKPPFAGKISFTLPKKR